MNAQPASFDEEKSNRLTVIKRTRRLG